MKAKLLLALMAALILAISMPWQAFALSTVDTATGLFQNTFERKSFNAFGLEWIFYMKSNNIYYKTGNISTGDAVWSAASASVAACLDFSYFSIWFDGTYVHYARCGLGTDNIMYRRGLPDATGLITWTSAEVNLHIQEPTMVVKTVSIATNTAGYPFISYYYDNGPSYGNALIKGDATDGTFGTPSGEDGGGLYTYFTGGWSGTGHIVMALSSNKMAWIVSTTAGHIRARYWDGSWHAYAEGTSHIEQAPYMSAVAQGDSIHIVFLKDSSDDIIYTTYSQSTNTFGAETTVYAGATATSAPIITRDTTNNDLWVYWQNSPTDDHNYLAMYDSSAATWSNEQDLGLDSDGLAASGVYLNADYTGARSVLGLYFQAGTTIIKFKYLAEQFVVNTLPADGVTDTEATLNGEIASIAWGSPTERGFYLNTSESIVGAAKYSETYLAGYGVGGFARTIGGLSPSTTYYFIAYATNAETVYGNWTSFTTLAPGATPAPGVGGNCTVAPEITTLPATYIGTTSARLNAIVNNAGCYNCTCSVYWQWYKSGGTWNDNQSFPSSGYTTGSHPYLNIYNLDISSTYYFRPLATNLCGNDTGSAGNFTTSGVPGNVTAFVAVPKANVLEIDLKWTNPSGATGIMIRGKIGEYPGNSTDGTLVVQTTQLDTSYTHTGLTAGDTWWYAAWGVSGNYTSSGVAYAKATVSAISGSTSPVAPSEPGGWWLTTVNYSNLSGMPFYGVINGIIDDFGFAREFFWAALGFMIAMLVFIAAYRASGSNILVSALAAIVVMGLEVPMGLMAGFMIFIFALFAISAQVIKARI